MTRVNLIPPADLHRKFLAAEYMEIPPIFNLVYNRQRKGDTPATCGIPKTYRFGAGHVTFFFDKLAFLIARHNDIVFEMNTRGYSARALVFPPTLEHHWFGHWVPSPQELALSRERIKEREKELGLTT